MKRIVLLTILLVTPFSLIFCQIKENVSIELTTLVTSIGINQEQLIIRANIICRNTTDSEITVFNFTPIGNLSSEQDISPQNCITGLYIIPVDEQGAYVDPSIYTIADITSIEAYSNNGKKHFQSVDKITDSTSIDNAVKELEERDYQAERTFTIAPFQKKKVYELEIFLDPHHTPKDLSSIYFFYATNKEEILEYYESKGVKDIKNLFFGKARTNKLKIVE